MQIRKLKKILTAFTLIELLTVMAVIVVLAGLVLSVAGFAQKKAAITRAKGELAALGSALEAYKADNGTYPTDGVINTSGSYTNGNTDNLDAKTMGDPTATAYIKAGLILYKALSGDRDLDVNRTVNGADGSISLSGSSTGSNEVPTVYYTFTAGQLLPTGGTGSVTGIVDPFGYSYGYSTAYAADVISSTLPPKRGYNPGYDLWTTRGIITGTLTSGSTPPQWITNWSSN